MVWLVGEESSLDETLSTAEQTALQTYLNGGGSLFISGAEIGYDLVSLSGGATFFADYLKAGYAGDDADTYTAQGAAGGIFASLGALTFDNGTHVYDVDWPDQLSASGGSTVNLTYVGGNGGNAGVEYSGTFKLVHLGFPWETILGSPRQDVMSAVLDFFIDNDIENWAITRRNRNKGDIRNRRLRKRPPVGCREIPLPEGWDALSPPPSEGRLARRAGLGRGGETRGWYEEHPSPQSLYA